MTKMLQIMFLFLCFLGSNVAGQQRDWKKVVGSIHMLQTTRDGVRAAFGNPETTYPNPYIDHFKIDGAELEIDYSDGTCKGMETRWNVPEFTVVRVSITFTKKKVKISDLPFGLEGFGRHMIKDVPNAYYYENNARGVDFTLRRNKTIEGIYFSPPDSSGGRKCLKDPPF